MFRQQAMETRTWAGILMVFKVVKQHIHGRLYRTGRIGGRRVAMDPALGMNDIGDTGAGAAHRELVAAAVKFTAFQVLQQGLPLCLCCPP